VFVAPAAKAGANDNEQRKETAMAHASRKNVGKPDKGKGSGSGARTQLKEGMLGENDVLSNRDKKQHSHDRGLDEKAVKTEQYQDHAANRRPPK
jgi:hypothetical protein